MGSINFLQIHEQFPIAAPIRENYAWSTVVASILMCFGRERQLESLVSYLLDRTKGDEGDQVTTMRLLREGVLKAGGLAGFPRGINSLNIVHDYLVKHQEHLASILAADQPLRTTIDQEDRKARGYDLFSKIYGQHTERVIETLNRSSGGDMADLAINHIYADILSEKRILGERETGLLDFACCLALGTEPQAKGHMFGAKNLGASGAEVRAVISTTRYLANELQVQWTDEGMPWLSKADSWS